ncbi:MAG: dehypoxanthine futalosine cyclase [Desulfovibrio sp.]|jgi:cyclic dehypoxanthinyl futalosine synthase|nr:dehypoxanthine futalosine cyclase [Desulfovibrio sp.]
MNAQTQNNRSALSRDALAGQTPEVRAIAARLDKAFAGRRENPDLSGPVAGARLSEAEASILYHDADLYTLGRLAHQARLALHPEAVVTYVADRNINYSNICVCACRFCAFFRPPDHPEGYVLSKDELGRKIRETIDLGGTQILMQGGHHPDLPLAFYEDLLGWIRDAFPTMHVHAFSPPEIVFFADKEGLAVGEVISRLVAAGLHSIPGGGAEILTDRVRSRVSPNKCSTAAWLGVMEEAHGQGLKTTATMMFGHEEQDADRLAHFFAVRGLQDRSGGFTAFIPWTFQPANTRIDCPPESAQGYLRVLAMSRLVLDNVPNIQASWVTMGPDLAQLALFFGANDFGSLMIEENVVAAAGVRFRMSREDIHAVIGKAGFTPRQRLMDYRPAQTVPSRVEKRTEHA